MWPKFTFLFLNVPRRGGSTGLGNIPKKKLVLPSKELSIRQGGITCGAIDEPGKSSKAIDERVLSLIHISEPTRPY